LAWKSSACAERFIERIESLKILTCRAFSMMTRVWVRVGGQIKKRDRRSKKGEIRETCENSEKHGKVIVGGFIGAI
jgi:hypothetical protein